MVKPITKEDFLFRATEKHGDKYIYDLDSYTGIRAKIKIICPEHGVFEQEASKHVITNGCHKCSGWVRKNQDSFIKEALQLYFNNEFDYSNVRFVSVAKKVSIKCNKHNVLFEQSPINHIQGQSGCQKCKFENQSNRRRLPMETFLQRAKSLYENNYDYCKVEYTNSYSKILIKCNKHNTWFTQTMREHIEGKFGCEECKKIFRSKGERFIEKWLKFNQIEYTCQKTFKTCKSWNGKNALRFDFYLPEFNALIEYDGEQHFLEETIWSGNDGELANIKARDKFKTNWASSNGFNLIRIPYTQLKNIDNILFSNLMGAIV